MVSPPECSALDRATRARHVARLVLYFDIFRHPLRVDELSRLVSLTESELDTAIVDAVRDHGIHHDGRWVSRAGRLADRERRWPAARRSAAWLARLPYVEGVLLTGSMSKGSAGDDGDIDFLLVVAPGRVWTVKAALHAARRGMPTRLRETMCTNYVLADDHLAIPETTMFTAVELATAVPMSGPAACGALLDQNPWAAEFVPGLPWSRSRAALAARKPPSTLTAAIERAVPRGVESAARGAMQRFWGWRYGWLPAQDRKKRFKQDDGAATNHLHDHSTWVARELDARCAAHGVTRP